MINLATPGTQKLGALFNKLKIWAEWLRRHPEVSDERLVVFIDALDVVWGGCDDFAERFQRLERLTSAHVIVSAELNCGGATPDPPGCIGTPPPPSWAAGPMASPHMLDYINCLPPRSPKSAHGARCSSPPQYKYLNSGGIAGRAGGVREMLAAALALPRHLILNKDWAVEDDQVALTRVWHRGNHSITLDYGANLFWSLSGIRPGALRYHSRHGAAAAAASPRSVIHSTWAPAKAACFVHASGSCHLPREAVRSDPLLEGICSLRRTLRINIRHPPPDIT